MLSICLWEQRESNPRPSACKADALNQLSYAPFFSFLFANYCVKLHSCDSHVTKYAPVFSFVFLVLDKNKLRNVSYQKNSSLLGLQMYAIFFILQKNQTGLILS